jgi:segregation and condensation protein B
MPDALLGDETMDMADQSNEPERVEPEKAEEGPEVEESGSSPDPASADESSEANEANEANEAPEAAEAPEADESAESDDDVDRRGPGPGADLSDEQITERVYALLFASPEPLTVGKLVGLLERPPAARVRAAIEAIGKELESSPLPYQLRGIKGGYTLMTVPEMGEIVGRLAKGAAVEKISPAALETLAIVAYRQPVTKAEVEAIRGVQAGPILRSLVDRALVRVTGRADVPGSPLQYGTTKDFLDRFGLLGLGDLPRDAELAKD